MTTTHDVVILGGGSGGYAAAFRASQHGLRVALVEEDKVGGTCLHRGCIPTKALVHVAETADYVTHAPTLGISTSAMSIDVPAIHSYKDSVVARLYAGLQGLVRANKVELVEGTGRYVGDTSVEVGGRTLTGTALVVATGSQVRTIPGIDPGGRVITSDEALTLDFIPQRAIVLGGGVIGVEFASIWASLGTEVTILEAADRIVPTEDPWSSKQLLRAFRKRGITVKTGISVEKVVQDDASVRASAVSGETFEADVLLVAVGRQPRTAQAGLAQNGVSIDERGYVVVDETLRTTVPGVYAVGDIVAGPQLAHRGFQQGLFVADVLAGKTARMPADENIPRVVYSNPEVASVGLTELQARARFGDLATVDYDLGGNGKSQIMKTAGGVKIIRPPDGPIVGIHMVGERMSELIGEAQMIVNWGAFPDEVADLVHAHPTQNEAMGEAHMALVGRPLHSHK